MERQHKRESHYEHQQNGTTTDRSQASRQRLFETTLMTVVALESLALLGALASTTQVVVMVGAFALVTTMPVAVPYTAVRAVTALLRRWESE